MFKPVSLLVIVPMLAACASTQVNFNSLEIASTYDSLITKQVVYNLLKTYRDPYSVPAYVRIGTQTASTNNGVNPTVTFPFTPTTALTETAAAILTGKNLSTAGAGANLQLQAGWTQQYTLSPLIDPDQLRRVRSIYQYASGFFSKFDFESDYPIIQAPSTSTITMTNGGAEANTIVSGKFAGQDFTVTVGPDREKKKPKEAPPIYVRRSCLQPADNKCLQYGFISVKPDVTFIQLPGCVMCDLGTVRRGQPNNVHILEKNPRLKGRECADEDQQQQSSPCANELKELLFFKPDIEMPDNSAIAIPSNGFEPLLVKGDVGRQAFYELALFTQEASSQGTGTPGNGGQSEGKKTNSLQTVSGATIVQ